MGKFSWGHAFFELNRELLALYAECHDSSEVVRVQQEWLSKEIAQLGAQPPVSDDGLERNPNHVHETDDEDEAEGSVESDGSLSSAERCVEE
jgi:pre-rRNA-processing protein TSR3